MPLKLGLSESALLERKAGLGGRLPILDDASLRRRFEAMIMPEPNSGCWLWMGSLNGGYGHIRATRSRHMLKAHRVGYVLYRGEIPDGLEPDHKCRVRCCVNPWHLEPVTHQINVLRGVSLDFNLSKMVCPAGHSYDAENTYVWFNKNGRPERQCRTCLRENKRRRRARRRASC